MNNSLICQRYRQRPWKLPAAAIAAVLLLLACSPMPLAAADPTGEAIAAVKNVGAEGDGFSEAIPAAERLRELPAAEITRLLDGIAETNPVAENWLRGIVFDVARLSGPLPPDRLASYAMDRSNNPTGRGLAMELLRRQAPERAERLIARCLDDPSLSLREMAVEQAIAEAESLREADREGEAKNRYLEVLAAARHPRQLGRIVDALRDLGEEVTTAGAFAMITEWHGVGPFDNVGGVGFDAVYRPEASFVERGEVDLEASYDGKNGSVEWKRVIGSSDDGVVDLAAAYNKEKGAVCYLFVEFDSSQPRTAEVRLTSKNANKVWVNGKEVMDNEVYHSGGGMIDQYTAPCRLQAGTNRILLKLCQNEQTESWAQEWEFQFRVTDDTGKGLRSGD